MPIRLSPCWLLVALFLAGCPGPCPDGFLRDNDGNCVQVGDDDDTGGDTDGFVLVSGGTFTMGSPEGELGNWGDEDQHQVTLTRDFWLQETEVTQAQWSARMGNNPSEFYSCGDDCPVETVNWWEALAYANAASSAEGLPECYTLEGCNDVSPGNDLDCSAVSVNAPSGDPYACEGYRLPTEAEWEYAYRAGTTTAFYNGAITDTGCDDPNLDAIGWYCGNASDTTHPVAQKEPNAWGLYDLAGNVLEWTWDWYAVYPTGAVTDPTGPGGGSSRVYRGGSWYGDAGFARAASRYVVPFYRYGAFLGFRLARSAP